MDEKEGKNWLAFALTKYYYVQSLVLFNRYQVIRCSTVIVVILFLLLCEQCHARPKFWSYFLAIFYFYFLLFEERSHTTKSDGFLFKIRRERCTYGGTINSTNVFFFNLVGPITQRHAHEPSPSASFLLSNRFSGPTTT